ncbi:MAG: acetyl-CoA carboxylase biotin carboxyl carrier protein [Myxococcota bacterium]
MDPKQIDGLLRLMKRRGVAEFTYETGEKGSKLQVRFEGVAGGPVAAYAPAPAAAPPAPAPTVSAAPARPATEMKVVKAPIVGTFYRSPAPDAPPYVNIGDRVKKGQVVCIIEAMKLMNQIESDLDGIVAEICVENGQPVQFGQELFRLVPG